MTFDYWAHDPASNAIIIIALGGVAVGMLWQAWARCALNCCHSYRIPYTV